MELHKAIKEIVASKGSDMITNAQIINYLLDYQAFKEKPATKLILRDVINAGYGESILALQNDKGWQIKLKQYQHEFIDSCGYKEDLAVYVFESLAYAIGLNVDGGQEPEINSGFNVDSFFDIPEVETQQPVITPQTTHKQNVNPADLYTIAQSFYNEGKYQQAKDFVEKAISSSVSAVPSLYYKLIGDVQMKLGHFEDALKYYNESYTSKSRELKCSLDELREAIKNHILTGFENSMMFYYFCLYSLQRMSKTQWEQVVKAEARYGLIDAIKYCADNGINPIEDHFNIYFTDRSKLRGGDYLYEDGTFAHEVSTTKKLVAKIILTETSDFEKSQGWTHGYIIPVQTNGRPLFVIGHVWSIIQEELGFPHSHYTIDDLNHWDKINKIESEYYITINDNDSYPAFNAATKFSVKIPLVGTSGWILPSVHWFKRCRSALRMENGYFVPYDSYWTSSQSDKNRAVYVSFSYTKAGLIYDVIFNIDEKSKEHRVLPIAVF